MTHSVTALPGAYDPGLVGLSIVIAIAASYAALRLGARTSATRGGARTAWLSGGAVAMGFGIWSMHYVGMLAFTLPLPVRYDLPTVIASLLAAIFASGVALFVVSRETVNVVNAVAGSIFMGGGIVAMHYTGMAAMRLQAMCHYNPALLALSGVIAVAGSLAALWLTFWLRAPKKRPAIVKIASAIAMGVAISAMHYTGMAAASFTPSNGPVDYSHAVSVSSLGTSAIIIVAFLILGFAVFTSVIDQRLAAHRALAEELFRSREMLQSILDNIPQRVFWKDRNGRYLGCNRAFAKDANLARPEEIVGKTDADLPYADDAAIYSAGIVAALEQGIAFANSEYPAANNGNSRRWLRSTTVPLHDRNGDIFGALGAYEDITERKLTEEAVQRSNTALSEFAHVVSHDLQSPLRVAMNYSQLLGKLYGKQLDEIGQQCIKFIEDSVSHMDGLIQALLKYATATEPEPGGRTQISLEIVLQRALANLQLSIEETNAEIISSGLPIVPGHPAQLVQLFQNLISNAIKYRHPDRQPRIHVTGAARAEGWLFSVRDNGIGIPREHLQTVFAPLRRLHGSSIPGFGIGLATCRKVVEHHGGQMWVESEVDVGSTFYFTLQKGAECDFPVETTVSSL